MMADVVGYSRMMGENEERTIGILRGHREVFDALLKLHRGRIFNTAGDSILAEFPSAVGAVRCATEAQAALRTRNDHLPQHRAGWLHSHRARALGRHGGNLDGQHDLGDGGVEQQRSYQRDVDACPMSLVRDDYRSGVSMGAMK